MGRSKPGKPKKPPKWRRRTPLQLLLGEFTSGSLWKVLDAAGRSPRCRSRWGSVEHLISVAATLHERGTRTATAADLALLLDAAHADQPQLAHLEDFIPEDPRTVVRVALEGRLYRLFPGNVERPIADLNRMLDLAALADATVLRSHGFRITDLIIAVLTYVDHTIAAVAPHWPQGDAETPLLNDREVFDPGPDLTFSAAESAALDWVTRSDYQLKYTVGDPNSAFGPALRVLLHGEQEPRWLPLAVVPEGLAFTVTALAREAAAADWRIERRFAQLVAARVRRDLWRFSDSVFGAPDDPEGRPAVTPRDAVQWVVPFGHERLIAVQLLASLRGRRLAAHPPAVVVAALRARSGFPAVVPLVRGELNTPEKSVIVPVIVGAVGAHLVMNHPPGTLHLSLEDLDWMAASASHDVDLWHFARELSDPRRPELYAMETINIWEWWRDNGGTLFRGGQLPSAMAFEPHRGSSEWQKAVELTPLEEALHTLHMPPVRKWDFADVRDTAPSNVAVWAGSTTPHPHPAGHHRGPLKLSLIHPSATPLALHIPPRDELDGETSRALHDIAGAFTHTLRAIDPTWHNTFAPTGVGAVQLTLRPGARASGSSPFTISDATTADGVLLVDLTIDLNALLGEAEGRPDVAHAHLADAITALATTAGAHARDISALTGAWLQQPPSLTIQSNAPITARNHLAAPVEIEGPLLAEVDRHVADAARAAGVAPGRYGPEQAKALATATIAPAALAALTARLGRYRTESLIAFGMEQLERALDRREQLDREVTQSAGQLHLDWDAVQRLRDIEHEFLQIRRSNEVVIEAALRMSEDNNGALDIDERGWAEVIAAAASYLEASGRSETLHYQLVRSGLEVSDLHELAVIEWDDDGPHPPPFAHADYSRRAAAARLESETEIPTEDDPVLVELVEKADTAFLAATGTTVADISVTLLALAAWPLRDDDADAVTTTRTEALEHIAHTAFDDIDLRRAAAALDAITSTDDQYIAADWRPWHLRSRQNRLITRPVPVMPSNPELIVVAPHLCEAVFKIYQGYWSFGQLPWTRSLTTDVDDALAAIRAHRNRALETQVDRSLRAHGWTTIARIKRSDNTRLGVPVLSTEIDLVAGRPDSSAILLLEVKDPAPVFTPPEIRRQLDAFFKGPKSYSAMLERKRNELAPFLSEIAERLKLPTDRTYSLTTAFITRREVPAAHAGGPFPFNTLPDVDSEAVFTDRV